MKKYVCKECGKEVMKLLPKHLILHGLTRDGYFEKHPVELAIYKQFVNETTKKNSANCIEYYLHRGMNQQDAQAALQKHRNILAVSLSEVRHLNPLRYDFWIAKGYTKEQAHDILSKKNTHNLEYYKQKYGDVAGQRFYNDLVEHHSFSRCEETQVEKISKNKGISEEDARDEFKNSKKVSSPRCKEHWLAKGYSEEESVHLIRQHQLRNLEFFVKKYGEEEGSIRHSSFIERAHRGGIASRESLKVLIPLYKFARRTLNIVRDDIFIGLTGAREKRLVLDRDSNSTKYSYFAYDFTIESMKVIVEFHGERWHPNPNKLSKDEWDKWIQVYTKESADIIYNRDRLKRTLAESKGYTYIEVWSSENKQDAIKRIQQTLRNMK